MTQRAEFPAAFKELFTPARYKVYYGGRGGAKSWAFARALLIQATQRPLRVLCTREFQGSIKDSVHRLLADQIEAMGLSAFFEVQQTEIRGPHGSVFLFEGLRHNVTKIKSMEGIDVVWCEEAERISEESWRVLIPTIRKPGSEIWVSFNPDQEDDPTYKRFVVNPPPGSIVRAVGWQDNPWFPDELRAEMEYDYRVDPDAAAHVWGGQCRSLSDAQVLKGKWTVDAFVHKPDWHGPYFGADWGFSQDPTALVKLWISENYLYVEDEAYGVGVEIDETPALFRTVPGADKHLIRADNARPETISYMNRNGLRVEAVQKGKGSVEDGVAFLRHFERIIIHPRCKHTAQEARLWSYKTDKLTGDVLPILLDKHNHTWDAARYALEPMIKAEGRFFV